ncbi:hypothetical protein [Jatrophihabitans endophyticus]|uniref:hypothetical protein n=1 Tax=Jatrophihabitans endophyticus TaxID=1206085 RepID=UPI0019EF7AE7|nr:hypothetical protein [Jatrophihabitans endophyticus]MBE7187539.1 hypothetical protein [Jatrophihabitans endophyticus]
MRNRLLAAGIAAPAALTLALALSACASSSTIDGQGTNGSASSGGGGSLGVGGGSGTATPTTTAPSSSSSPSLSLAAKLGQGLTKADTAHLTLNISAAGQAIVGRGDEQLSKGRLVALDLTETVTNSISLRLVIVHGKTYVRLPSSLNQSGKPWQLVSTNSSNATIRQLATSLASTQSSASLSSVTALVSAARSVKQTSSSATGTTYSVDVDPSKLPGSYEGKQALVAAGLTSLPITIRLDPEGRPTLVTEHLSVEGQKVSTKITIGSYNKAVHIAAPPASQVSTH